MRKRYRKPQRVTCPYCNKIAIFVDSKILYGASYGMIYLCKDCDAYVGCHPNGDPKGTLANASLRQARVYAHQSFDKLWKSGSMKRGEAYIWLAGKLNISLDKCHIAMFDENQCSEVIGFSDKYYFENIKGDM